MYTRSMSKVNYQPSGKTQGYVAPENQKGDQKILNGNFEGPSVIAGAYKQANPATEAAGHKHGSVASKK